MRSTPGVSITFSISSFLCCKRQLSQEWEAKAKSKYDSVHADLTDDSKSSVGLMGSGIPLACSGFY